jgi:serine/threonine-protein kinase HipA
MPGGSASPNLCFGDSEAPRPVATRLDVFAAEQLTGTLSRSDVEIDTFLFGYLKETQAEDAVSLTMPVVADQYDSMGTVHPIFEMNLPEGALLERLRLTFAKAVPDLDSLGLLAIVGQSQIGRLSYALSGSAPAQVPAQDLKELLTFKGAEDLFDDLLER